MSSYNSDQNRRPLYSISAERTQAPNNVLEEPTFQFSVLTCSPNLLLTKTVYADGSEKPWDNAKYFAYKYLEIKSLEKVAEAFRWLMLQPRRAIVRAQLLPGLSGSQRRLIKPEDNDPATLECPDRSWVTLDLDGVKVPYGLGAPDKLVEAGYHIRDTMLPMLFRQVRCIVVATAKTGRAGPDIARLRFFFPLPYLVANDVLAQWATDLKQHHPELELDPSVMLPSQINFTARPIFEGCSDPVSPECRVAILGGPAGYYAFPFEQVHVPEPPKSNGHHIPIRKIECHDCPEELLELTARDAGCVPPLPETSRKAKMVIKKHVFEALEGCPKPGGKSRHRTFRGAAWTLACLVSEGEITEELAKKAYWAAANGINNSDGLWTARRIAEQLKGAFARVGRR
jgi:hypothetical protein